MLIVGITLLTAGSLVIRDRNVELDGASAQMRALTFERDIHAAADAVRAVGERPDPTASLEPQLRSAATTAITQLDDFGYGDARDFGASDYVQKVDYAWNSVVGSDGGAGQVNATLDALGTLGAVVANVARTLPHGDEPVTSLIDAYAVAIPSAGTRLAEAVRVAGGLHGEAGRAAEHARSAFRDVSLDVARAASAYDSPVELNDAYKAAAQALDDFALAAEDSSVKAPRRIALAKGALGALRTLAATVASEASAAGQARLAALRSEILWAYAGIVGACVINVLIGTLLARNVGLQNIKEIAIATQRQNAALEKSESERMRELLELSETRFAAVFDRASLGVAIISTEGRIVRKNQALQVLFPHASAHDVGARYPEFERLIKGEIPGFGYELDASEAGRPRWLDVAVSVVRNEAGAATFAVSLVKDTTERRESEEQLRRAARFDPLLDIPNRLYLTDHMEHALLHRRQSERPAGVLFLAMETFNVGGEAVGHEIGDQVLIAAARRLEATVGQLDFISRFGGDEFVLVLEGHGERQKTIDFADAITRRLAEPFDVGGREVWVNVYGGITLLERPYSTVAAIIRDADTAMQQAKRLGGARLAVFDVAMRDAATRQGDVAVQLRRAIEREEVYPVFQPMIELATGRAVAFEVLLRWEHPTLGMVSPGEFIPVAEEAGLIVPIGRFVLDRACAQFAAWRKASRTFEDMHIAVNVSAHELAQADFCDIVEQTISRHDLRGRDVMLEVTESTVLASERIAAGTFERLRRSGIRLSIDDFGTGYSSLKYLETFPFDQLKIDGSFVYGKSEGLASEPIVALMLELGRSFGVEVVAEGVETKLQAQRLVALGCQYGQGYYFERPMKAALVPGFAERLPAVAS